jgi:hypothetical protein
MGVKADAPHSKRVVGVSAEKNPRGPPRSFLPVGGVVLPVLFGQSVGQPVNRFGVGSGAPKGMGFPSEGPASAGAVGVGGFCTRKTPVGAEGASACPLAIRSHLMAILSARLARGSHPIRRDGHPFRPLARRPEAPIISFGHVGAPRWPEGWPNALLARESDGGRPIRRGMAILWPSAPVRWPKPP